MVDRHLANRKQNIKLIFSIATKAGEKQCRLTNRAFVNGQNSSTQQEIDDTAHPIGKRSIGKRQVAFRKILHLGSASSSAAISIIIAALE